MWSLCHHFFFKTMGFFCHLHQVHSPWSMCHFGNLFCVKILRIDVAFCTEMTLSETGATLIETIPMVQLIRYLKIVQQIGVNRWPNVIFNEGTSERKQTWMRQNYKWMQKWNIYFNVCPTNSKELTNFVMADRCGENSWIENNPCVHFTCIKKTFHFAM